MNIRFPAVLALCAGLLSAPAHAMPIDLNDFFADPTVTVAGDGSSALFAEDPGFAAVLLVNDPGLGDPEVIVAAPATSLQFRYDFFEAAGEDDVFNAFLLDAGTGLAVSPAFSFSASTSSSGLVSFDISSLVGTTLGMQFSLETLPGDTGAGSTLRVFDVALVAAPRVPEPASLALLALGGATVLGWRRRRG